MSEQIKKSDIAESDIYGEIRKSAELAEKQIEKLNEELRKSAKASKDVLGKTKMGSASDIKAVEIEINKANKTMAESLRLEREAEKLAKTRERARLEEIRLQQAREKNIDNYNKKLAKENDSYHKLVVSTRELKNESKRLGAELLYLEQTGKKNTKEFALIERQYRQTTAQAVVMDGQLKKLDSTVGDNFRNVGNYNSAVGKLKNGLAQLGLSFGVFQAFKFGATTVMEFQTSIADLSAITGATGKDLDFLENKAIEFSKKYGQSAKDVSEAFKLAGSARPELLKNGDALAQITEQAIILSKASGDDVPTSIANLTGTLNAFELPSEKAGQLIDILANASQKGAQEIPYLTEAFTKFGAVAKNAGVSVQDSAAAVEILGEKMPSAEMAGINLRNILVILQQEASKQGRQFKGLAGELELLKPKMNDVTFLAKTFGRENLLATQTLIGQTDRLKSFSSELNVAGTAQEMANTKSKTLGEAFAKLKASTEAMFLEFRDGASGVAKLVDFLAENLGTIVSLVVKLGGAFLVFKGVMKGLQLQEQFKNWRALRTEIAQTGTATTEAGQQAKGFGNAMKGIGITVLIGLVTELAMEFYDVASGTAKARDEYERYQKELSRGQKFGEESVQRIKDGFEVAKRELDLKKAQGKITESQYKIELAELNKLTDAKIKGEIQLANENKKRFAGDKAIESKENATLKQLIALQRERKVLGEEKLISDLEEKKSTDKLTKSTEKQTEKQRDLNKSYEEYLSIRKELSIDGYTPPEVTFDDVENADQLIQARRKAVIDIEVLQAEMTRNEDKIRKARIKAIQDNLALELENIELSEVEKQRLILQSQKDIADIEKQEQQKRFETTKQFVDATADYFIKKSEEKIAQLDKEIQAGEKQFTALQELANQGNLTAQQSLAEQQRIINDANRKKIAEQKRIERIKLAETAFGVYTSKLDAGDKNPLLSTIKDVTLLNQFIQSLPAFEEGTENTGVNGKGVDGKGGFHAILHPNERVLTAEQNEKIGTLSNVELSKLASDYNNGKIINLKQDFAGNSYDLLPLLSEIKDLKRTIEQRPTHNIAMGEITQSIMQIVEKTTKGNRVEKTTYNIRK